MSSQIEFEQVIQRGCGLDVHQKTVVATVSGIDVEIDTRTFGTFTAQIEELKTWLNSLSITHIAMESTGVYWKPVYNILEEDFKIILVNARHIKNVPGHKTDKKDSEWIAKLLLSGLLKGSFVPTEWIRELRDLCRYKRKLIAQRVAQRNRLHKILEDANIKLASVASDIFGVTGTLIIDALIRKQDDPEYLANLAKGSLRKKMADLKLSLQGRLTEHHRFMLATLRDSIDSINAQIGHIEARIERYAVELQQEVDLLQTIPGIGKETAMNILAESGNDMEVFPDHKHLASWAGVSPGNNESAGKKKSTRITHGNKYLKTALVEAAWAASHTKDTYLGRKYGAIAARRGSKKALIAVAHKILTGLYYILKNKEPYLEPDDTTYQEKRKQAQIKKSLERLRGLGVQVDIRPN
ncbi:IS110 family transposase [Echinicola vietnamensis]|uniref:Transposase n=1 Tax=Echinicola vietnamensis (strain DSM 17526 / LMG 23754 / KMM 6221) TaxID=926556 RepID=L0G048_ECHVK|nr:IS110 family transposase [Echinicola vietnamensis]AGA76919.1 transposase [Echinicola vietnamensis DSM 17526]AGA77187.1 transposase [Echinicola vietnamensis DSM 17526]AGA78271.1 transposase [Echinicola vietnamensis DSM 17526]AGA79529.1 transposase [Echinicola vietnamensis DSM 17526]